MKEGLWLLVAASGIAGCLTEEFPSGFEPPDLDGGSLPPATECDTTVAYAPTGATPGRVTIAGDWNEWSPAGNPLTDADGDGRFEVTLKLAPGRYGYKLVVDGLWLADPANPYTLWNAGEENSLLRVRDCARPRLAVLSASASADGRLLASVQYQDGAAAAGADPDSIRVFVDDDDEATEAAFADGNIEIDLAGASPGKHVLRIEARDADGRAADELLVPLWVEPEVFSWEDAILYFVFTDRFRNGDPENDAPVEGVADIANYMGGDLMGVLDAIDEGYFDDLGVRALWLSPVNDNTDLAQPGTDGRLYTGYHGYWPTDGRTVDEHYGDVALLEQVVDAAHAHGIRIVLDLVLNHVHTDHGYWDARRMSGWFNGDGSCICGQGDCGWDTHPIDCWFTSYLPDLDYRNPDVVDSMVEDALYWVREVGVDGFRLDAVKHMQHVAARTLAARINDELESGGVPIYLVGETFTGEDGRPQIAEYIGPNELDGQFDFPLYWPIVRTLLRREASVRDLDGAVLDNEGAYPAGTIMAPFLGNHDIPRAISHAAGDIADLFGNGSKEQAWNAPPVSPVADTPYDRLALAFLFLLTQPGTPLVYYGDEIGLPGAGDPDNRRMMPADDALSARQRSLRGRVQAIGQARRDSVALRRGARRTIWVDDELYVFTRGEGEDLAIVAINASDAPRTQSIPVPATLGLGGGVVLHDRLGGPDLSSGPDTLEINLPARRGALYLR